MKNSVLTRLGLAVALLFAVLGAYWWWQTHISAVTESVNTLSQQIQTVHESIERASLEKTILSDLAGEETTVQSYFVSGASIVSFLNVLEKTGRASGSEISIVSVSPQIKSNRQPMLVISAKAEGSFDSVMRTVGAIENVPYYAVIKNLTIEHTTLLKKAYWTATFTLFVGYNPNISTTTTP